LGAGRIGADGQTQVKKLPSQDKARHPAAVAPRAVRLGYVRISQGRPRQLIAWHSAYDDPFFRSGLRCFALTLAAVPGPFLALLAAGPRFAPSQPRLAGAAVGATVGAVSGVWAAIVVELWCPLALPAHVIVGHVLPLVALSAAGALFGPRLLGLRRV